MQRFQTFATDVSERLEHIEQQLTRMQLLEYQLPRLQHFEQQLSKLARKVMQVELGLDVAAWTQEADSKNLSQAGPVARPRPPRQEGGEQSAERTDASTRQEEAVTLLALSVC